MINMFKKLNLPRVIITSIIIVGFIIIGLILSIFYPKTSTNKTVSQNTSRQSCKIVTAPLSNNFNSNFILEVKTIDGGKDVDDQSIKDELWIIYSNGTKEKLISPDTNNPNESERISNIFNVTPSLDKTKVYFNTSTYVTSPTIHMVNLITKSHKYITDGNLVEVIKEGKYKGDLRIEQSRLTSEGRKLQNAIVDDNGKQIATW